MKKLLFLTLLFAFLIAAFTPHELKIKGKVINEKNQPVAGASVIVKGTSNGTATNENGEFAIIVPGKSAVIVVSVIGYAFQEVRIKNEDYLTIKLKPATMALNEVVITGYGVAKQKRLAGAPLSTYAPRIGMQKYASPQIVRSYELKEEHAQRDINRYNSDFNTEGYDHIVENPFLKANGNPLSTFSIDVDAASYSNIRRMINYNKLPPAGAVRIEEMINYFTYDYPQPTGNVPFSVNTEIAACPWNPEHRLVSIGLQGKKIAVENLPASNLTFLIDVSGSMQDENKLPLVKSSLKLLTDQLRENDRVSIVVYAGSAGLVLPPTSGSNKMKIKAAVDNLEAGGSTAGGEGIKLAYKTAKQNLIWKGNNRVILCTDGDFNVGMSSDDELERLIEEERKSGVFLTVLGYGKGNYQDAKMQKLADKGNGNHAYIDSEKEAKKVLVSEFGGTLFTIAKDVKLQIEFNPEKVQGYRLIGYENRMLAKEDFNDDKKDAGELGSGHTVTALYEVIPVGVKTTLLKNVDGLRYQQQDKPQAAKKYSGELMNIKLRYKQPDGEVSRLIEHPVMDSNKPIDNASENFRFAAAVAKYGMLLRNSKFKGAGNYEMVSRLAGNGLGTDKEGYRREFIVLVDKTSKMDKNKDVADRE